MDFKTLHYFVTVAEELNITRAAERLNMSQPPLSTQIRLLEEDYGTQLFIRNKKGLMLSPTGEILYKRARQILELAEHARLEVDSYEKELSGNLRLGTVEGRAPFLLARWIAGFTEEFPLVTYTVRSGGSDDILDQLYHHLLDIAVIAAPYNQERLYGFPVSSEPWVAIIPKEHPLAAKEGRQIRLSDLSGEPLIVPERPSRVEAIEHWFEEKNLHPVFRAKTSNYIDAVSLAEQGVGICIFPQSTYTPNPLVVTRLITDPPKKLEYVLVYTKDGALSELAETFRDFVEDFLAEDQLHSSRFAPKEEEFTIPENAALL